LIKTIFLAGGCFWCTEAVFRRIIGVVEVLPGYIDGTVKNPSYREVCRGLTGHAEAILVRYDSSQVNLTELLLIFFNTHDPTSLNRQGNDVGTQYRSGIYFTDMEQKRTAKIVIDQLINENAFTDKIVTEIKDATPFYEAEKDHHDYYSRNKEQAYCTFMIDPKIDKIKKYFSKNLN
jgi:peptide-methionine (S)-S-oxide reductase